MIATYSSDQLSLSTETPLLYRDNQWALHTGLVFERGSASYLAPSYTFNNGKTSNSLAGIALSFNNSRSFRRSISMMDGRTVNLGVEKNSISDGNYEGYVRRFEWREYLRLGDNSVAALRFQRGQGEPNTWYAR